VECVWMGQNGLYLVIGQSRAGRSRFYVDAGWNECIFGGMPTLIKSRTLKIKSRVRIMVGIY